MYQSAIFAKKQLNKSNNFAKINLKKKFQYNFFHLFEFEFSTNILWWRGEGHDKLNKFAKIYLKIIVLRTISIIRYAKINWKKNTKKFFFQLDLIFNQIFVIFF